MKSNEFIHLSRQEKAEYRLEKDGWVFAGASGISGNYYKKVIDGIEKTAFVSRNGKIEYLN